MDERDDRPTASGDAGSAGERGSGTYLPTSDLIREQAAIAARRRKRRVTDLPKLIGTAIVLVWRTNRLGTCVTTAVQLGGAAVAAGQVLLAGYAIRELIRGGTSHVGFSLLIAIVGLAAVTLAGSLSANGGSQVGRLLAVQVERRVTADVLDVSKMVELIEYDDPSWYDQLARMLSTLPTQPPAIVTALINLVGGFAGSAVLVAALLALSPVLVVVLILSGVPMWFLSRRAGSFEFEFAVAQTAELRERQYLVSFLTQRETAAEVRAYRTDAPLQQRWSDSYESYIQSFRRLVRKRYALQAGVTLLTAAATAVTLVVLILLINHGSLAVAQAAAAVVAVRLLASRIELSLSGIGALFQSALFLDDFRTFSERILESDNPPAAPSTPDFTASGGESRRPLPFALTGRVELRDVSFTYPNATAPAVSRVSLALAEGQIVALVGENGSGKSTLAKLLAGLYVPHAGTIQWSTTAGGSVDPRHAASQIALVLQDFARYQLSALDNITFGRPEEPADSRRAELAAASAGIDNLIRELPLGYSTRLSRQFIGGRELSVGQWQRMALARAFYRDGSVIILDEPAAALDPRAEAKLYESVARLLTGRTVVLVTHRMRSVRYADRIIVMENGAVVEEGHHDDLIDRGGLYAELATLQDRGAVRPGGRHRLLRDLSVNDTRLV